MNGEDSACFSVNLEERVYKGRINEKTVEGTLNIEIRLESKLKIRGKGYLYIGQEQDFANGGFSKENSLRGYISDYLFYKRTLTKEEMVEFTTCQASGHISRKELIFDFSNLESDFEIKNVTLNSLEHNKLSCNYNNSFFILFRGAKTFFEAKHHCMSLGGKMVIPKNKNENIAFFNFTNENKDKCPINNELTWLGIVANENENYYQDYQTGVKLSYTNIRRLLTTDWTVEKCLKFYGSDNDLSR